MMLEVYYTTSIFPKASFFGFSNGGNTSIQIAVRHPEIVNKLILASTFYKKEKAFKMVFLRV